MIALVSKGSEGIAQGVGVVYCLISSGVLWGMLILAFSQSGAFLIAILLATLVGMVSAFNMSLSRGMVQLRVDDEMRGRVMSIGMVLHGLAPVGTLLSIPPSVLIYP